MGQRLQVIRRSDRRRWNDSGFTLTELLIVIVILGVLTGIVVFAVGQFNNRGEISACKTAMKTTEVAIETYRANNSGQLPAAIGDLVPDYLRTDPGAPPEYDITINYGTGAVTGDLAGGATTVDCSA